VPLISFFFLFLVLNASFLAVYNPLQAKENTTLIKNVAENQHSSEDNNTPKLYEDLDFHAVVNVGLQCEFQKITFDVPQFIKFIWVDITKKVTPKVVHSAFIISFRQILFHHCISINAP
jgi:hypothetical protein